MSARTSSRRAAGPAAAAHRTPWHFWLDAGVLAALLAIGVLGFGPSFGSDPRYLVAGLGGIVLGLAVAAAAARWRLGLLTTVALGFLAYLLLGSPLAAPKESLLGILPSLDSLRGLLLGVVFSWKQLLTLAPPVGVSVDVLVVPYLSALVTGVVAGTLAWRVRSPYWTLLPVLALFATGIAFGTTDAYLPVLRGVLLAVGAIAWLAFRHETVRRAGTAMVSTGASAADSTASRTGTWRRLGLGAGVVVVAGTLAFTAAPALTASPDRSVLRDVVVPPPNLHDLPSPLTTFRAYVKDKKDDVLFTVDGLPKGGRVRIAALDDYDGVVFNVDANSSASFAPVGDPKALAQGTGDAAMLGFEVKDYRGVWIPGARVAQSLSYTAADGASHTLYLNKDSDTALSLDGVQGGDKYSLEVAFPQVDGTKLAAADFAQIALPKLDNVPQVVDTKANDIVGAADTPLKKVQALESTLQREGKFSNGLEGQTPSTSGHGAARITKLLSGKEMVGDDEQYAVAMALMARHLGIPARVVMGFYLDEKDANNGASSVQIKGSNVHAWVEVDFAGLGWVPFNPTPDKDHIPNPPDPQNASQPKPQVLQPPPPPQEPADLPPDSAPDALDTDGKKQNGWSLWGPILAVLGIAAIPLAIVAIPLIVIALLKTRRRKRRAGFGAPADRVGGGWAEVLSAATDLGAGVDARATRRETAGTLVDAFPQSEGRTVALAARADASIFGPGQPSEEEVAAYWSDVDASVADMTGSVGFWKRQRARFSPRSLFSDARAALEARRRDGRS
ncbi:DUF3488 and transglutaminase-like domain-containing protein [Arthrobacter sp. 35W]|uniref:DUF3488 and transglutaminase-like domain-containing protein n=1 Tax=Arthrobacter sp. 35W TaxID=1132441 RepID=UPI0004281069|nr:transglutaminase domain-containing protein [Arthrobacter sp. 35W]